MKTILLSLDESYFLLLGFPKAPEVGSPQGKSESLTLKWKGHKCLMGFPIHFLSNGFHDNKVRAVKSLKSKSQSGIYWDTTGKCMRMSLAMLTLERCFSVTGRSKNAAL